MQTEDTAVQLHALQRSVGDSKCAADDSALAVLPLVAALHPLSDSYAHLAPYSPLLPWMNTPCGVFTVALVTALSACGGGNDNTQDNPSPDASPPVQTPTDNGSGNNTPPPPTSAQPQNPRSTACDTATGPVLEVGSGKKYATPSAAASAARAGDVVRIAAGDYRADVATWKVNNLTICGTGGRARLFADGRNAGGKAIWIVMGSDITIDSVEFHKAAVPDQNGAGIRAEHQSGDLRIINSGFFDNENGILTANYPATLTVERSEFAYNNSANTTGNTHNIYVGTINRVSVSGSYFHETRYGHNFKSRAKVSVLENNYLMDGPDGMSSYMADFPNGGQVFLRGNLIHKGPKAENPMAIEYGVEGQKWATNTLEMVHNTVVTARANTTFLRAMPWTQSVQLTANIFASVGTNTLISGTEFPLSRIVQQSNVTMPASHFPGASNIAAPNFWPDAAGLALTGLPGVLDANYRYDSLVPYTLRPLATGAHRTGAMQSAP